MSRHLFPESNGARGLFGTQLVRALDAEIGDNLHEASDKQISRLVSLKFGGNPYLLIRQLSLDLASKEAELILLRKQTFQREQELIRLCTEYGDLSSIEIDQRLHALKIEDDVHKVLAELIDTAIDDPLSPGKKRQPRILHPKAKERTPRTNARPSKKSTSPVNDRLTVTNDHHKERPAWLQWFNSTDDLRPEDTQTEDSKVPVELQSIGKNDQAVVSPVPDASTDRYGFYNDAVPKRSGTPVEISSDMVKTIDKLKHLSELHDAKNDELIKKWDLFMRDTTRDGLRRGQDLELFGAKALSLKSASEDHWKTLLRLVNESGIPPKYRNKLWFELSGAKNKEVHGEFRRLVELAETTSDAQIVSSIEQINLDLHRTMPSNHYFNDVVNSQPGPHFYRLRNILYAFVVYKPDIGYSQGMNKMVGSLLLGVNEGTHGEMLTEEDVFWIFVSLSEDFVPSYGNLSYFHKDALPFIRRDLLLVQNVYCPRFLPALHQHFQKHGVETEVVMLAWWIGLFTESFVLLELWFKIFDSLLLTECPDVKFVSLSLAILKLFEGTIMELVSGDDIYRLMNNLNLHTVNQRNIRFSDLISVNNAFEKQIDPVELESRRRHMPW